MPYIAVLYFQFLLLSKNRVESKITTKNMYIVDTHQSPTFFSISHCRRPQVDLGSKTGAYIYPIVSLRKYSGNCGQSYTVVDTIERAKCLHVIDVSHAARVFRHKPPGAPPTSLLLILVQTILMSTTGIAERIGLNAATSLHARIQGMLALFSLPGLLSSVRSAKVLDWLPRGARISRSLQFTLKAFIFLVLILNVRALPGGWHWRLFWPVTKVRLHYMIARTQSSWALIGASGEKKKEGMEMRMEKWLESITPVGAHPFEFETRNRSWVSKYHYYIRFL